MGYSYSQHKAREHSCLISAINLHLSVIEDSGAKPKTDPILKMSTIITLSYR
jgi:hypothetical protein